MPKCSQWGWANGRESCPLKLGLKTCRKVRIPWEKYGKWGLTGELLHYVPKTLLSLYCLSQIKFYPLRPVQKINKGKSIHNFSAKLTLVVFSSDCVEVFREKRWCLGRKDGLSLSLTSLPGWSFQIIQLLTSQLCLSVFLEGKNTKKCIAEGENYGSLIFFHYINFSLRLLVIYEAQFTRKFHLGK